MKRILIGLYFLAGLAASSVFGADPRYSLTEYSMNGCAACVAALKDVAEIAGAGIDVRCVNTSVDPAGEAEARRFNLRLRPAWRLASAQGVEIGRWYGSGKAGIIVATIRAKFPIVDEQEPIGVPLASVEEEETAPETSETIDETSPELAPSALAELDALKDEAEDEEEAEEDFRNRKTVSEPFVDAGFLDKSLDEWNRRGEDDDENDDAEEFEEDEESQGGFFSPNAPKQKEDESDFERAKLGDRIADRAATTLLKGLAPKIESFQADAFAKLERIGDKVGADVRSAAVAELNAAKAELFGRAEKEIAAFRKELFEEIEALASRVLKWVAVIIVCAILGFFFALRQAAKAAI